MLHAVVGGIALATTAAFVLAPLVRPEDELEPLDRPRSGVRDLAGTTVEERERTRVRRERRCPDCGRAVERTYDFCGDCVRPLPA